MKKKSFLIISLLLFVSLTAAQPNETAQTEYSPGLINSGSPLYGLELAADNAAVSIGIKKASTVAKERVAEVESASERNDTRGMERASQAFENVAKRASTEEAEEISEAENSLERVIQNAPERAQQGLSTALENVRKDRMNKTRMAEQNRQENSQNREPDRDIRDSIENRSPDNDSPQDGVNTTLEGTIDGDQQTQDRDGQTTESSTTRRSSSTGRFDLMISDRPADISKFDFVNVSFSEARIFMETHKETNETGDNQTTNETTTTNETVNDTESSTEESEDEGYTVVQLNNSSVDLTTVVGDKAQSIADIELDEGNYTKVELYSSNIDAEINGSSVDVKIPPKKLMINKPFEVSANETTQFVFDIQVVLRGNERNNQGYILKPVISESGVAGKDVNVTENEMSNMDEEEQERNETEQGGPPANPGSQAQRP